MNVLLDLFLTFLKIGAVSFGGGYGMISLLQEEVLAHGWMTEEEVLNFIAVSESTPGPIAVNMATFVGATQGGLLGSFLATLGVVLPAFVIMLVIVTVLQNLLRFAGVKAFLSGVRPCVVALIVATGVTMLLSTLFTFSKFGDTPAVSLFDCIIFVLVAAISFGYKKLFRKKISPILLILVSAVLGILFYTLPTVF